MLEHRFKNDSHILLDTRETTNHGGLPTVAEEINELGREHETRLKSIGYPIIG